MTPSPLFEAQAPHPFKVLLLAVLSLGLGYQCLQMIALKTHQHILLPDKIPYLPQGTKPGQVSGVVAIQSAAGGSFLVLSNNPGGYLLQRFDGNFAMSSSRQFPPKGKDSFNGLAALALFPDGGFWLLDHDGKAAIFRADWSRAGQLQLQLAGPVQATAMTPDGKLMVLESTSSVGSGLAQVALIDESGKTLQESLQGLFPRPLGLAVTASGRAVVLDSSGEALRLLVFDPQLQHLERSISLSISPANIDRVAPAGGEWVAVNDGGWNGFDLYDAQGGTFLGCVMGPREYEMEHPGFIGGDAATDVVYIHSGYGLSKVPFPH